MDIDAEVRSGSTGDIARQLEMKEAAKQGGLIFSERRPFS
jgi:hypothetical protein